jgi:hypothetical protein
LPDDPEGNAKLMLSILDCLPRANRVSTLKRLKLLLTLYCFFSFINSKLKFSIIVSERVVFISLTKNKHYLAINTESYEDRSGRRASRAAWKQSQCVASGQTATTGNQPSSFLQVSSQHSINRTSSALSHSQQSSVSIRSGSVSSIASSLANTSPSGK